MEQLSFCTHGLPGKVCFKGGHLTVANLSKVAVPKDLFKGAGRLLFMGCDTARGTDGETFLIAAGKHFLAGKGGVVGGTTIHTLGFSSGTRLPLFFSSSESWGELGNLVLFHLDADSNVIGRKTAKAFGL